ncbi:MAG: hypothetical protein R3E83_07515 [Burkholderiaceae bacterium]
MLQSVDPILELFDLEHQLNQGGPDQRTDRALRVAQHASDVLEPATCTYRNIDPNSRQIPRSALIVPCAWLPTAGNSMQALQ